MKKLIRMLALLLAFTLIAAACGDDEDSGDDPPADDDMVDDSGDGDVPAGVAAAQAVVDANSSAPTSITPSTPSRHTALPFRARTAGAR